MNESSTEHRVLILGLGNLLLMDEGVGVHVAQRFQRMQLSPEVEVVDGGTGGFELIKYLYGKSKVIIVDCVTVDAEAGSIVRLSLEELELRRSHPFSAHQGGIQELLAFIGPMTPKPVVVFLGIVPAVVDQLGTNLSPELQSQLPKIITTIIDELNVEVAAS